MRLQEEPDQEENIHIQVQAFSPRDQQLSENRSRPQQRQACQQAGAELKKKK
jgi:hypothetical protein